MTVEGSLIASSPMDALMSRLAEPRVADALNDLLDHADVLAIMVVAMDGLVRRGDAIADAFNVAVSELRDALPGTRKPAEVVDLGALAKSLATLAGPLTDAAPALKAILRSDLTNPQTIDIITQFVRALVVGAEAARTEPVSGVLALMRTLNDDDVVRGLGFLLQVVRAFGGELKDT
ncbi:MAG: DUF1641 domain-containing protein [Pseudonocardiaceae bacterium]